MQASLEKLEGLNRRLMIEVPEDKVTEEVKKHLNKLSKTAKVSGFRPGKVPANIIEQRYGDAARGEALDHLVQTSLYEAFEQEKLNPAGRPSIDIKQYEKGKPLQYAADFEVYPEIKLHDLKDIKIEQIKAEVTDEDVNNVLENLRKQQSEWIEVDRKSKNEDQVIIDFEGFMDKKPFDGGKAENVPLILGSHSMIEGFEEGIVGMKADDEKEIKVKFPKEYHSKELAEKPAVFKIKVHKVSEPKLPEVNDEFAKKFGIKEDKDAVKILKENIKKSMKQELTNAVKSKNKLAIMDKLLEKNKIDLPKALVEGEIDALKQHAENQFAAQMGDKITKKPELPRDLFRKQAERRVALGLLVAEIVKQNNITVDADRLRKAIEEMAANYDYPEQIVNWYYEDKKRLAQFELVVIEDQVIDKLLENAKVGEKSVSYDDAMKPCQEEEEDDK